MVGVVPVMHNSFLVYLQGGSLGVLLGKKNVADLLINQRSILEVGAPEAMLQSAR